MWKFGLSPASSLREKWQTADIRKSLNQKLAYFVKVKVVSNHQKNVSKTILYQIRPKPQKFFSSRPKVLSIKLTPVVLCSAKIFYVKLRYCFFLREKSKKLRNVNSFWHGICSLLSQLAYGKCPRATTEYFNKAELPSLMELQYYT